MNRVVLVCGGRNYDDAATIARELSAVKPSRIIHGGASGADRIAAEWAHANGVPTDAYPAAWLVHGRAAGPIRNAEMLRTGKPDLVVAFPGGLGTKNMIEQAIGAGIPVTIVDGAT